MIWINLQAVRQIGISPEQFEEIKKTLKLFLNIFKSTKK